MGQLKKFLLVLLCCLLLSCGGDNDRKGGSSELLMLSWDEIVERARGETVTMMMWKGDQNINDYMQEYVKPELKKRYGIDLQIAGGQGNTIVSILKTELEAGKTESEMDLMWINGETFYQLRRIEALFGPFVDKLPNAEYLDLQDPFVKYDFQQPIRGYECPWGTVQFTMIHDTTKIQDPPRGPGELEAFVKAHPGRFTISSDFTGMTLLKSLMIAMAGEEKLQGAFDPAVYKKYSRQLFEYINRLKPHFWRSGNTFPESVSEMHRLYANGEIWMTMSNNEAETDNKIAEGLFPRSSRGYVLESGTIRNSHYLGIPKHSNHRAAAMVAINFMISPGAQLQKLKPGVWGDGTVLKRSKLSTEWQQKFREVGELSHVKARSRLRENALRELAPKYMIKLYEDFRQQVVR